MFAERERDKSYIHSLRCASFIALPTRSSGCELVCVRPISVAIRERKYKTLSAPSRVTYRYLAAADHSSVCLLLGHANVEAKPVNSSLVFESRYLSSASSSP